MIFPPINNKIEWNYLNQGNCMSCFTVQEEFLTSASSSPATGYEVPGMEFMNPIRDHLSPNCDLSKNPGYSRLLIEQYEIDARKNPALAVMAGVFSEDPQMTYVDPNLNKFSLTDSIGIQDCGDAVGTDADVYSHDPFLLPPLKLTIPSFSNSIRNNEKKHICTECGDAFDRWTRARDCAYKDLGQTPHQCGFRCGKAACTFVTSSEQTLTDHINPRSVACPLCSLMISKKNLARHQKETCINRNLAANAHS